MGRSRASKGGSRAAKKAPLIWETDGITFRIAQENSGLTDESIMQWVADAQEALEKDVPERQADGGRVTCSVADFSNNQLGDEGVGKIVRLLLTQKVPVLIARFFKNGVSDAGAASLARLLTELPEPLEELHISHNRITALGAGKLLGAAAAAGCPPTGPPTWLRLENNLIDWQPVAKHLEYLEVCWAASESRSQVAQLATTRNRKKGAPGGKGPPQVLVHRSYRHQSLNQAADGSEQAAVTGTDAAAPTSTRKTQAKAEISGPRYESHELLFMKQLLQAKAVPDFYEGPTSGLRCRSVSPEPPAVEAPAEETKVETSPPAQDSVDAAVAAEQEPRPKGRMLSLEEYLKDDLPPVAAAADFAFNAKATEFVPGSPANVTDPEVDVASKAADFQSLFGVSPMAPLFGASLGGFVPPPVSPYGAGIKVSDLARLFANPPVTPTEAQPPMLPITKPPPGLSLMNPGAAEFCPGTASTSPAEDSTGKSLDPEVSPFKMSLPTGSGSSSTSAAEEEVSIEEVEAVEEDAGCAQS